MIIQFPPRKKPYLIFNALKSAKDAQGHLIFVYHVICLDSFLLKMVKLVIVFLDARLISFLTLLIKNATSAKAAVRHASDIERKIVLLVSVLSINQMVSALITAQPKQQLQMLMVLVCARMTRPHLHALLHA